MSEALTVAGFVLAIGAGILAWYHGTRARRAVERAEAAESALQSLRSVNTNLRAALERTIAAVADRNTREAQNDARTAETARADAGRAADLLNGLHQDR